MKKPTDTNVSLDPKTSEDVAKDNDSFKKSIDDKSSTSFEPESNNKTNKNKTNRNYRKPRKKGRKKGNSDKQSVNSFVSDKANEGITSETSWIIPKLKVLVDRETGRKHIPILFEPKTIDPCADDFSVSGVQFKESVLPISYLPEYGTYRSVKNKIPIFGPKFLKKYFRFVSRLYSFKIMIMGIISLVDDYDRLEDKTTLYGSTIFDLFETKLFIKGEDFKRSFETFCFGLGNFYLPPSIQHLILKEFTPELVVTQGRVQIIISTPMVPLLVNEEVIKNSRSEKTLKYSPWKYDELINFDPEKLDKCSKCFHLPQSLDMFTHSSKTDYDALNDIIVHLSDVLNISYFAEDSEYYYFHSLMINNLQSWRIPSIQIEEIGKVKSSNGKQMGRINNSFPIVATPKVSYQEFEVIPYFGSKFDKRWSVFPEVSYLVDSVSYSHPPCGSRCEIDVNDIVTSRSVLPSRSIPQLTFWFDQKKSVQVDTEDIVQLNISLGTEFEKKKVENRTEVFEPGLIYSDNDYTGMSLYQVYDMSFHSNLSSSIHKSEPLTRDIMSSIGRFSFYTYENGGLKLIFSSSNTLTPMDASLWYPLQDYGKLFREIWDDPDLRRAYNNRLDHNTSYRRVQDIHSEVKRIDSNV